MYCKTWTKGKADTLVHLYTNGEVITTTETHPFYVADRGWVRAKDLKAGTILVTETGQYVKVDLVLVEECEAPVTVYNLEIEDFHTYFVGGHNVWVHNTCGGNNIDSYNKLKKKAKGTGNEVHHILEKRFAKKFGLKEGKMDSIILSKAQHRVFTNSWRKELAYGKPHKKSDIIAAAKVVYADHPQLLQSVLNTLKNK